MILVRHKQNAFAKAKSGVGSHTASALYHFRIVFRSGNPPFSAGATNWVSAESMRGWTRFARSERGCPIVESSQSKRPMTCGSVGWKTFRLALKGRGGDHVIKFIVAVDDTCSIAWEIACKPLEQLRLMRYRTYFFARLDILGLGLGLGNCLEGLHLSEVIAACFAKPFQSYISVLNGV
jgi:hypothetical protein